MRLTPTLRRLDTGDPFMAEKAKSPRATRPLSPHLQIYRWPVTMAASIAHRVTGLGLTAGTLLVTWWLVAAASGTDSYDFFSAAARSPAGQLVLFGFVWSLAFHLLNGVRHLAWDLGAGFELRTANRTGIAAVVLSFVLAVAVFAVAYVEKGLRA